MPHSSTRLSPGACFRQRRESCDPCSLFLFLPMTGLGCACASSPLTAPTSSITSSITRYHANVSASLMHRTAGGGGGYYSDTKNPLSFFFSFCHHLSSTRVERDHRDRLQLHVAAAARNVSTRRDTDVPRSAIHWRVFWLRLLSCFVDECFASCRAGQHSTWQHF